MSRRDSLLEGAKEAKRLHQIFGSERNIENTGGRIDVFGTALQQDATVMFRDLKGILGAYLNEDGSKGILVTTQRRLAIQRFTGAHELGHLVMGHEPSIDKEEVFGCFNSTLPTPEIEANAFAAEFLSPRWLLAFHASRHSWGRDDLRDPICVYQLSLRIGISYEATCHSLLLHKLITDSVRNSLLATTPKKIKQQLLFDKYEPAHWHGDVWVIEESDRDLFLEGHSEDIFLVRLREKTGSGYLWNIDELKSEGFKIVNETRTKLGDGLQVGGDVRYEVTAADVPCVPGQMRFTQKRPWEQGSFLSELNLRYDLRGKEESGISRAERLQLLAA